MAFFIAFYSYKGGVGRSMALANVAYSLAERGKRVVLLDMDLEAPSLHDIPEFSLKGEAKKGLIEHATSYRQTGRLPALKPYIHRCRRSPGSGELWLMPAGRIGPEYQQQLGDLSWRRLHPKQGTQPYVDGLRQAIEAEINPHYVLIDSRTGLSDIGGISTHLLADMVVLVFNLTWASIEGSVRAYRSFTTEGLRFVQLVASPVPLQSPGESLVETRIKQATELMPEATLYARSLVRIEYNPGMALAEELAVRQPDRFPAAAKYEAIRESIQRANPAEVFPVVEQALLLRSSGQLEDAVSLLRSFTSAQPLDVEGHLALGNLLFEAERYEEASSAFEMACDSAPALAHPHRRLGEALVTAGRSEEAVAALKTAESLGDRSRELYLALARAHGQCHELLLETEARRKAMLAVLGQPEGLKPSTSTIKELRREFIEVLQRRPPFGGFQPVVVWDEVMGSLSLGLEEKVKALRWVLDGSFHPSDLRIFLQSSREEKTRWTEVLGEYASELQSRIAEKGADPRNREALLALQDGSRFDGALLGLLACQAKSLAERVALFRRAIEKDPGNEALLFGLRTTLGDEYQEALRLRPDDLDFYRNYARELLSFARSYEGEKREDLALRAAEVSIKINERKPGEGEYTFACALAQLGELGEAEASLRSFLQIQPGMRRHALDDPDLAPFWQARPELRKEIEDSLASGTPLPTS